MSTPYPSSESAYSAGGRRKSATRLGQDVRPHPRVVRRELRLQGRVRLLPSRQLVLGEERRDAIDVALVAPQLGLDLAARGIQHPRLSHVVHHALLQHFGKWRIARIDACILAQSHHRRWPPLCGHLLIQQCLQSAKDHLAGIEEAHIVGVTIVFATEAKVERFLEDREILANTLIRFRRLRRLQLDHHRLQLATLRVFVRQRRSADLLIELAPALPPNRPPENASARQPEPAACSHRSPRSRPWIARPSSDSPRHRRLLSHRAGYRHHYASTQPRQPAHSHASRRSPLPIATRRRTRPEPIRHPLATARVP